jgi:hypothetical protein
VWGVPCRSALTNVSPPPYQDLEIVRTKEFDGRVWQPKPKWVIEAGALSISNAQFASLQATAGQCTFQVQVPSTSVYLDRLLNWQSTVSITMNVTPAAPFQVAKAGPGTEKQGMVVTPGLDFSLCASPIHSLVTSLQAAIGDTQVTNNLAQTRELMSLLADTPQNRKERTQPCYLDTYMSYIDSFGTTNNPISGYERATTSATEENGSWPIVFSSPVDQASVSGLPIVYYVSTAGVASKAAPAAIGYDTVTIAYKGAAPQVTASTLAAGGASAVSQAPYYPVAFSFTSIEPLQLSPFIWQEVHERMVGLSQLQNINIIANMQSPDLARLVRWTPLGGRYISAVAYGNGINGSPFSNASIQGQFLTPPIELMPIPPINTVDFQQVVSYVYPCSLTGVQGFASVASQTLSLPVIPDYLVVAVVPQSNYYASASWPWSSCEGTWYVPINAVSITWSNMSGLLSSQSQSQLFNISKANGLDMSWAQWRGYASTSEARGTLAGPDCTPAGGKNYSGAANTLPFRPPGLVATQGGPLVLRPGKDITLETGQASGMSAGQWTVQFQLQVDVSMLDPKQVTALGSASGCSVVVLAVNGGFFATKAGSSRVVIGPVPAGSVANAAHERQMGDSAATGQRLVGAGRQMKRQRAALTGRIA